MIELTMESEIHLAAQALAILRPMEPVSGAFMHRGATKTTYLIEADDRFFVACRYAVGEVGRLACTRAALGLDSAAQAGLGPMPLRPEQTAIACREGHWWTGYGYLTGSVLWGNRPLDEMYNVLGALAALWHARCRSRGAWRYLAARFEDPIVDPEVASRALAIVAGCRHRSLLHGDLNASNVVLTPEPRAIDFDEVGAGPPELELAIALGYVNTSPDDLRRCFEAILAGYSSKGGVADANAVAGLASVIPWYMTACQSQALCRERLPREYVEAAAAQACMISAALD